MDVVIPMNPCGEPGIIAQMNNIASSIASLSTILREAQDRILEELKDLKFKALSPEEYHRYLDEGQARAEALARDIQTAIRCVTVVRESATLEYYNEECDYRRQFV